MRISPSTRDRYRFAFAIGLMAVYCVAAAVHLEGLAWILVWPAFAFGALALAYAGLGESIFGKRDGRVPISRKVILAPWLALQTFTWWLQGKLGSEAWYHRVHEHFYIGRHPRGTRLPDDVDLVVDLTAEFDATSPDGVEYINLATLDACGPELHALRELLARLHEHEGVAYIHCASGHGRSGTVCAGLLMLDDSALSVEDAEAKLQEIRPGVGLSVGQKRTLEKLFVSLG